MTTALCDVVQDNCTDAARKLGVDVPHLFLKAAENCRNGQGFTNNPEVGERFYRLWVKGGYRNLPPAVQEFVLECNEGQHQKKGVITLAQD